MRIKVDLQSDALYFRLDESKIVDSEEERPGIILDYNEQNKIVGIEILRLQENIKQENLKKLQFETV
ncbi:MAG: DUF2283 domain-containing protein [Ignavibacteria bacterium]|nr:DUF2283 domain-containing protein [Ignavibacteria bacterium]